MLAHQPTIRPAREADAPALVAIYAPYIERTPISFETVVPSAEEFAGRIRKSLSAWQYLVAERDGRIVGYAYGGTHRERAAYRFSVEVSAYVDEHSHRQGIGRALYTRLFDDLAAKGYCEAFAGITWPNDASIGLHSAMGFTMIGIFRRIGWKFDRWHDVAWMQRTLKDGAPR
jgi:L-amino acid N-acyltransferase YncA